MTTCIYCPAYEFSEEHPLPAGLGKFDGYVSLTGRICKQCNNICGKLDEQLCRSGPEAFFRQFLGIRGRKEHERINSFYRGGSGGSPLEMLATNQRTGQNVLVELLNDKEARELRSAQLIADDGSLHVIRITDGMTPEEFRRVFDSFGISHFKEGMVYAAADEHEWVESLLATLKTQQKTDWAYPLGPITYGPSVVKFTLTSRYFRAIAKMGFHYFLTKMTQFRGDEPCFSEIRAFVMSERCPVEQCMQFVGYRAQHIAWPPSAGAQLASWGHFLAAQADYLTLTSRVELFAGPGKRPLSYTVNLGRNPSRLDSNEAYADFFEYLPKEQRTAFDGIISPLPALVPRPTIAIPILGLGT